MKQDSAKILKAITERFVEDTGFTPVVAGEIEFYLKAPMTGAFKEDCYVQFGEAAMLTFEFAEERAENHYEISLVHLPDPIRMAANTALVKKIISETSKEHGLDADFTAKPFSQKPGSGLHIHLSLKNKDGINPFTKRGDDGETPTMKAAIGGLCAMMPESMMFFAPNEDSYARYTSEVNEDERARYNNAPVNISWGGNNRTTAIRIPSSTLVPEGRHIEHRVAGSDADPALVIAAVLAGVHFGLTKNIDAGEKVWGNAFEKQYNLPPLPASLKEAKELFKNGKLFRKYLPD